jgi:hypothetical protein
MLITIVVGGQARSLRIRAIIPIPVIALSTWYPAVRDKERNAVANCFSAKILKAYG